MTFDRWYGVHTGGPHYLDHLGILCDGLEIPLLVTEYSTFQVAKEFYPTLQVGYIDLKDLSLHYLAERADVIFESGHAFSIELLPLWELMYGKKMRVVYCPHGNSDKKAPKLKKDISLIYGEHMRNHLENTGEIDLLEKVVVTGNYRAVYYWAHQKWYEEKLKDRMGNRWDPRRKTVFYAPTWERKTWFKDCKKVIEDIGSEFNLLIRLHPFLEDQYPAESEEIKGLSPIDLSTFPSIYPILHQADYYLGDFSSVGYDFLTQNKPLFFLGSHEGEIYDCGCVLAQEEHYGKAILSFQDTPDLKNKREALAKRVFGDRMDFKEIKNEIKEALSYNRAPWMPV